MVLLQSNPELCPRLLDYVVLVGARTPNRTGAVSQTPEILRRYPPNDHSEFHLPPDVVFFCQPEGCFSSSHRRLSMREVTSFVFTLTEKDSGLVRYGICLNFYRPIERKAMPHNGFGGATAGHVSRHGGGGTGAVERTESMASTSSSEATAMEGGSSISGAATSSSQAHKPRKSRPRTHTLTSLCIITHHPFFSKFRQCLHILKKIIERCHERSKGPSRSSIRESVWSVLTGSTLDCSSSLILHDVREIETWILRLLSAPVPVPSKTRVNLAVLPETVHEPLVFALPDRTRLSLVDFPLHLPLELLGVDTCLRVLTCIMLEHKVVLQSRDYNSLTMSVMAFVSMLYPLQYMFPVIPLLPTCMTDAEQLLLAPTPFIIGIPASFLLYKKYFKLPNDVWLVDLDACNVIGPTEAIPELPEPEGTNLRNHLRQALTSMSSSPQPIHDLDSVVNNPEFLRQKAAMANVPGFNPLIYGNDVDSIDVATRVAMVRFLNSANMLANFSDHTRNLRFYPRPVVAFQYYSFLKSRPSENLFVKRFARTQAVEYFGEWSLYPDNLVFQRIQTGIFDPQQIGDKPKWFMGSLQRVEFRVCRNDNCTLHFNWGEEEKRTSDAPTDESATNSSDEEPPASPDPVRPINGGVFLKSINESGSDSDGIRSISSSYSSLNDFVTEMIDSGISGEAPAVRPECHMLTVDLSTFFTPPRTLFIPEDPDATMAHSSSSEEEEDDQAGPPQTWEYKGQIRRGRVLVHRICITSGDERHLRSTSSSGGKLEHQTSSASRPPRPPPPTRVGSVGSHPGTPRGAPKVVDPSSSGPEGSGSSVRGHMEHETSSDEPGARSILSNLGEDLTDAAAQATHMFSELLGLLAGRDTNAKGNKQATKPPQPKPHTPLGNRQSLVEKSGLMRNAMRRRESLRSSTSNTSTASSEPQRTSTLSTDNQVFLKEIVKGILEGKGVSLLHRNKVRKLMEDENYRAFVSSKLNPNLEKKISDPDAHIEDIAVEKYSVFKGLVYILSSMVAGLQTNCMTKGMGGMSSVFCLLEIASTHYFMKDSGHSNRSDSSVASSPFGSQESLAKRSDDNQFITTVGQPLYFGGEEYENIEVTAAMPPPDQESSDLLRDIVLKKGAVVGNASPNLLSPSMQSGQRGRGGRASPSEGAGTPVGGEVSASTLKSSFFAPKSKSSGGYRYHNGQLLQVPIADDAYRNAKTYIFEAIVNRERSRLWDNMQFWEDAFLDAVAQEREIVGMDLSPTEMIDRYTSLGHAERKRLEADEDRLLGTILYDMISFMVMMKVEKPEIRLKIRRLVAKSHIGLAWSQELYNLLDNLEHLNGNAIDLKPFTSRFMQKQAFSVRRGSGKGGDMLFMEVCDDCLVLRSVTSYIVERWWFEKIVSITYSPKTKVLCLWTKEGNQTAVSQFYTKRCKELYQAIEESMERASVRAQDKQLDASSGRDGSGKFPVQDMVTGEGGLLQVCMEGIGLIFQNNKFFIELPHIKSCCTQNDDIFLIEEWDPISKEIKKRRFKSKMCKRICFSVLSSISSSIAQHSNPQPPSSFMKPLVSNTKTLPKDALSTNTAPVSASLAQS